MTENERRPKIVLFDLSGMVHRAFHGNPFMAAKLALGFGARILRERKPTHAAAAVDRPFPTFRHDLAGGTYKAKNRTTGDERARILEQLRVAEELFEDVLGIRSVWAQGFEADDAIATLAHDARARGLDVLIVTRDKDLMQLVTDRVLVFDHMTGETLGAAEVEARVGVPPARIVDYLSLVGDATDCYPGCPGIGPKIAKGILASFASSLAAVEYAAACSSASPYLKGTPLERESVRGKLVAGGESVRLCRTLAALRVDVPLGIEIGDLVVSPVPEGL